MTDEEIRRSIIAERRRRATRKRIIAFCLAAVIAALCGLAAGGIAGLLTSHKQKVSNTEIFADIPIVNTAAAQLGNKGGEKFWSWYGFDSHVSWCACFVSWCADQAGYLDSGVSPKFSSVGDGISWFEDRGQWLEAGETPSAGDYIFYDWEQDGYRDHVGIVTGVADGKVYTIEGNSSDLCRIKCYPLDAAVISGYGHIETSAQE